MASGVYTRGMYDGLRGVINYSTSTIMAGLVSTSYVFNKDHNYWKAGSTAFNNQITGTGYTAGGQALLAKTLTKQDASDNVKWDASNSVWGPGATFSAGGVVLRASNAAYSHPLICFFSFGTAKIVDNGTFTIQWSTAGIAVASSGS